MARTNIKLNITIPGKLGASEKIVFTKGTADGLRIPYRYPFADIANYNALKNIGYFRHATSTVNTSLGSNEAGTEGRLGFELPYTEKLILLVKKGAATAEKLTIVGSSQYRIDDLVITIPAGAIGDLYEIDLYDYGLFIADNVANELGLLINEITTTAELALIVRMA